MDSDGAALLDRHQEPSVAVRGLAFDPDSATDCTRALLHSLLMAGGPTDLEAGRLRVGQLNIAIRNTAVGAVSRPCCRRLIFECPHKRIGRIIKE